MRLQPEIAIRYAVVSTIRRAPQAGANSYLFEKWAAYPYAAGHFESIEVPFTKSS